MRFAERAADMTRRGVTDAQPMAATSTRPPTVVCHLTTVHPVFDPRIFHRECRTLADAGYIVHLVACHDRDETIEDIHIHALPRPPCRAARVLVWPWLAYRRAAAIRPRPAIFHFHDPELLLVAQALRGLGGRVIYDVHENVAEHLRHKDYLPRAAGRTASLAYRAVERLCLGGLATVHVLETIAARYPEPRAVVRNLPELRDMPPALQRTPSPQPRLLYLGDICRERGTATMIETARRLAARGVLFEMRLVGPIREAALREEMLRATRDPDLGGRFTWAGPVPYQHVPRELAAADLGLCLLLPKPNYLNSLATKLVEYMAAGLPVVASKFACWKDIIVGTGAGVQVDPEDPGAVAEAIETLLADPARRREMGQRGREAVCSRYRWDVEKERLLDFYRRLLGGGD